MSYIMLAKPLAAGATTAQQRARWSTGSALVVITPSLMLWALGLTVTDPSFHPLDWPSPQRYLGVGVLVAVWGLALWWVLPERWVKTGVQHGVFAFLAGGDPAPSCICEPPELG